MTVHFILSASGETLLAPGPTPFRPAVFEVMAEYSHPAHAAFGRAHHEVCDRLGTWFSTRSDVVIVSGSGTSLMEAGIASLTEPGTRGLVISHGKFGDRFIDIAHARARLVETLRVDEPEWGRAVTPAEVRLRLDDVARGGGRVTFLCLQQNETSSGVSYHAQQLAEIVHAARAHDPGIMVIVDAISGAFAHPLAFDALDVDLLITGSQKGLGVSSGLAYGVVSSRALRKMLRMAGFGGSTEDWEHDPGAWGLVDAFERRQRVRYLGLLRAVLAHRLAIFDEPPSVFHVLSSLRALQLHDQDGGSDAVLARHAAMAQLVRDGLAAAGLRSVSNPPYASNSVTPAFVTGGTSAPELRKQLQAFYGLAVAGAQGDYWKAQMIRIGHLGFVYPGDLARCLRALRIVQRRAAAAGNPPLDAPPAVVT
jgi:aspartate aminotransferase-like enzyme